MNEQADETERVMMLAELHTEADFVRALARALPGSDVTLRPKRHVDVVEMTRANVVVMSADWPHSARHKATIRFSVSDADVIRAVGHALIDAMGGSAS